jgi:hypothetical protein
MFILQARDRKVEEMRQAMFGGILHIDTNESKGTVLALLFYISQSKKGLQ